MFLKLNDCTIRNIYPKHRGVSCYSKQRHEQMKDFPEYFFPGGFVLFWEAVLAVTEFHAGMKLFLTSFLNGWTYLFLLKAIRKAK